MAGHAVEKAPGIWELRVYIGRDMLTGRKKWKTKRVKVAGKRAAQLEADAYALELLGQHNDAATVTVGAHLERWYEFGSAASLWTPGTQLLHRRQINTKLKPLHALPLASLQSSDLDDFYAALRLRGSRTKGPLKTSTVKRTAGILSLALQQAVRWNMIRTNPADNAQPGKQKKTRITPPSNDAVVALLAAAKEDTGLLTYLFLDAEAGARRGEVAALRLDDFTADTVKIGRALATGLASAANAIEYAGHYWPARWSRGELATALIEKEPKNEDSIREIALCPATLELVRLQADRNAARVAKAGCVYPANGFLFPAPGDGLRPLRPDSWTERFTKLRNELGLNTVRLHDIRHFVATTLLTNGVDLATVAGRLGHGGGGKTTLAIYGHFTPAPDRASSDLMAGILQPAKKAEKVVAIGRKKSAS